MLRDTPGRIGPASSWDALDAMIGIPSPEIGDRDLDMLCWYDGPQVSVGRLQGSPSHYLEIHYVDGTDTRPEGRDYPVWSRIVAHLLEFPTREILEATLHADFVPTLESYRTATSIQKVVREWTLHESGVGSDMYESRTTMAMHELPTGELPDEDVKPGPA